MEFKLLLVLLLSHFFFDFAVQGRSIINKRFPIGDEQTKDKKARIITTLWGNLIHAFFHFLGIIILMELTKYFLIKDLSYSFNIVILIGLFHFIVDEGKSLLVLKDEKIKNNIWIFLFDQALHIGGMILLLYSFDINRFIGESYRIFIKGEIVFSEKLLIIGCLIICLTYVVGIFIKTMIGYLSYGDRGLALEEVSSKGIVDSHGESITRSPLGARNGGFIIGVLERVFIVISIIINFPAMIGFILTVKSIARLKKLSNDSFAEYFIIGNFLSFIPAILIGMLMNYVIKL